MKKKSLIIILSIIICIPAIYFGTWLFFKQFVWMPHVKNATEKLTEKKDAATGETTYHTEADSLGDHYYISIPRIGIFDCHIANYPSIIVDNSSAIQDERGNTLYNSYLENGSDFRVLIMGRFSYDGSIQKYKCDVDRFSSSQTSEHSDNAFFIIGSDGTLINEVELSNKELQLYEDAKDEITRIINKSNEIFSIN